LAGFFTHTYILAGNCQVNASDGRKGERERKRERGECAKRDSGGAKSGGDGAKRAQRDGGGARGLGSVLMRERERERERQRENL